ncbi:hypothetical protein [Streptomyces sp. NPDC059787]
MAVVAERGEWGIPVAPKVWHEPNERAAALGVTVPAPAVRG